MKDDRKGIYLIRRAINYCERAEYEMRNGYNSPFLKDSQPEFAAMIEYYEMGKNALEDHFFTEWETE